MNTAGINNFNQIWKQESQWKELLSQEIEALQRSLTEKDALISEQNVNLEDVKKSFIFNYALLQARDAEIANFEKSTCRLISTLKERDAEISELKITIDQQRNDLVVSRGEIAEWKSQFEMEVSRAAKQEAELQHASAVALAQLTENESKERLRLSAQITRLQSDIESERLRAKVELDAGIATANQTSADAAAEAAQLRLALELRVSSAEETVARIRLDARRRTAQLEDTERMIAQLQSELAVATQTVQKKNEKVAEMAELIESLQKQRNALELKLLRHEASWKKEKQDLLKQLEDEAFTAVNRAKEAAKMQEDLERREDEAEIEQRRLLNSIARAEKQLEEAVKSQRENERERQLALRQSRLSEAENSRLREDLERALTVSTNSAAFPGGNFAELVEEEKNKNQQLANQLTLLRSTCNRLVNENAKLKEIVAKMSVEATFDKNTSNEVAALREKLNESQTRINSLQLERENLLQLSNRLQATVQRSQPQSARSSSRSRGSPKNPRPVLQLKYKHIDDCKQLKSPRRLASDKPPANKKSLPDSPASSVVTGRRSALSALNLLQDYLSCDEDDSVASAVNLKKSYLSSTSSGTLHPTSSSRLSSYPVRPRKAIH